VSIIIEIIYSSPGRHCVITGGSSGIGLWVAIYAAKKGADVTIVARNVKTLGK
jgi:3-dehydrosphinganine reductase